MIDARNVYRKVTRKIYDFSPEQLTNLTAIVWLYRGQQARFLELVKDYFGKVCDEIAEISAELAAFDKTLAELQEQLRAFSNSVAPLKAIDTGKKQPLTDTLAELADAQVAYAADRESLIGELETFGSKTAKAPPVAHAEQHLSRQAFDPLAERIRGLIKQVDLIYKLVARAVNLSQDLARDDIVGASSFVQGAKVAPRRIKQLDDERKAVVEQLKLAAYFHRQIVWLQDRFPEAVFAAVPGLCKIVTRTEIAAADWSLTPGRYVGVAPPEEDEGFDFEQTLRDIHVELADLNREAAELATRIQANFEELGV
jgi:type I restriction enzyme M protein